MASARIVGVEVSSRHPTRKPPNGYAPAAVSQPPWSPNFDFYMAEKCIYEIGYELNNRPAWLPIPLSGLLEMLDSMPTPSGGRLA